MRAICLTVFILLCAALRAQSVYGVLVDSASGDVIPFANVLIKGTLTGKQTDEKGSFTIHPGSFPATLVFTCIGYKTREVKVTQPNKVLTVILTPSAEVLREVVINSDPLQCIQKDQSLMASDFEFCDNYLIVLAYRDAVSPARLMLLDETGANMHTMYVSTKMESLYRDCFGRVHLLSKDSSWQVYYDYEKLQLLFPVARDEMEKTFTGIDLFFAGRLFSRMYTAHHQRCDFISAYKGNHISFHKTANKTGLNLIATNYDLSYFLRMRKKQMGYLYSTDYIKAHLEEFQNTVRLNPKDSFALRPVQARIIQHNYSVWVFDFTNNLATRFDEQLNKTDSVFLTFHLEKGWTGDLIRDEATDDLYTTYEVNGITKICKLNDHTLDIQKEWFIEDKPFIVNLRIRNGVAFFLWIDRSEYGANRMLYRYWL